MPLYLSPYIGAGARHDPFRPTGLDQPGSSAIDIRLDPTVADGGGIGFAFLWLPSGIPDPVGSIKLADDYGDLLTTQQRNRLNQRTGLDFGADTTIQDAVETIMARADIFGWKRLRPTNGMYQVWLGSSTGKRLWVNLPSIGGGSISDSFTRANETPIASPWTEQASSTGDVNLSSNAITKSASGDYLMYYANGAGWNADHSSQFTVVTSPTNNDWGPAVRVGSSGFSAYYFNLYNTGSVAHEITKIVTGTFSTVEATSSFNSATAQPYKIDVSGSTISYSKNGVADANSPATDTSLTTAGNGPGLFWYEAGGSIDDFLATGEISASTTLWAQSLL